MSDSTLTKEAIVIALLPIFLGWQKSSIEVSYSPEKTL
jgi:hypothetical protein